MNLILGAAGTAGSQVSRLLAGPLHPGIRYLLDMALAESTMPEDPSWVPRALDRAVRR